MLHHTCGKTMDIKMASYSECCFPKFSGDLRPTLNPPLPSKARRRRCPQRYTAYSCSESMQRLWEYSNPSVNSVKLRQRNGEIPLEGADHQIKASKFVRDGAIRLLKARQARASEKISFE